MSYSFRVLASFILGLALTFVVTAVIFTLSGCKTPEAALASCDSAVKAQVDASVSQGYKLVDTQTSPAGELAAFVNAEQAKARVYYVTPVAGAVDYLTKKASQNS